MNACATTRAWTCQAHTDIWTGDVEGRADRLITTGLLGSIRWWFEVLVRGLGGRPCDPLRSLLSLAELQSESPPQAQLAERGVVELYRSQRITQGKYRNFAPARAV